MTAKASAPSLMPRRVSSRSGTGVEHWHIPASDKTVHWGYFSKALSPLIEIESGSQVTIECVTNNASDDYERLIKGDLGAESIFYWTRHAKNVDRRGAGPQNARNGAGGGKGAHICTGPIYVRDARPGDVLEVQILDMRPRRSANPRYRGKAFGINIAGRWGFHCRDTPACRKDNEVITVFEIDDARGRHWARPVHKFHWRPVVDPFGVVHANYDYTGLVVDRSRIPEDRDILKGVRVPLRPHFGILGVAPSEAELVSSVPPNYSGGNIDNWRMGKGATLYLPVAVDGALFSAGDTHAAQGDGEISGSAIESSWTGRFEIILHKKERLADTMLAGLDYPLLESKDGWIVHGFSYPNYLAELGPDAQRESFANASIDMAMRDAYRKIMRFLRNGYDLSDDEAVSLISVAVDFGITQVVDANLGVHAILDKRVLQRRRIRKPGGAAKRRR